jgi:serine/threonine-protein kinase PpkA
MRIPGYRVERLIGQGGMASVYQAVQESLARPVALKLLPTSQNPEFSKRFLNEGRIIASLSHSNIITIYDLGILGNCHYISMEYLDGGDLDARIERGLTSEAAVTILEQLAGCLHFVHERGIIHRDVKPANILFRSDGTPVLTDFGIAKELHAKTKLTATGAALGTPYYLSPEQLQGAPVTRSVDIYSLGIVFYEMLTGEVPYQGDSYAVVLTKHLQAPLPELPPRFARLQPLLNRLIAKDPRDRFRSADEVLQSARDLRRRSRRPAGQAAEGTPPRRRATSAVSEAPAVTGTAPSKGRRHWPAVATGAALLLAAVTVNRVLDGEVAVGKRQASAHPGAVVAEKPVGVSVKTTGSSGDGDASFRETLTSGAAAKAAPSQPGASQRREVREERAQVVAGETTTAVVAEREQAPREEQARTEEGAANRDAAGSREPIGGTLDAEDPSRPIFEDEALVRTAEAGQVLRRERPSVEGPLPPMVQARIERLLALGESRLQDYRLTSPPRDNAYHYYRQVLELDPLNRRAKRGMVDIANAYHQLAQWQIDRHRYTKARSYIGKGLFVQPDDPRLLALRQEISASYDGDYGEETIDVIREASAHVVEKSRQTLRRLKSFLP